MSTSENPSAADDQQKITPVLILARELGCKQFDDITIVTSALKSRFCRRVEPGQIMSSANFVMTGELANWASSWKNSYHRDVVAEARTLMQDLLGINQVW